MTQVFDDYLYISQKPVGGNIRSTVATSISVSTLIVQAFAKQFKQNKSFFSNLSAAEGMCTTCAGTGILIFGIVADHEETAHRYFPNRIVLINRGGILTEEAIN